MVIGKKSCFCKKCKKVQPTYNYEGQKAKYCFNCKEPEMIDVKHIKCKTYLCSIRPQDKFEGYCLRCFIYNFPDRPISKNYKTKEYSVVEYIKLIFPNFTWVSPRRLRTLANSHWPHSGNGRAKRHRQHHERAGHSREIPTGLELAAPVSMPGLVSQRQVWHLGVFRAAKRAGGRWLVCAEPVRGR